MKGLFLFIVLLLCGFVTLDGPAPVVTKAVVHPCKKSCRTPQAVSERSFSYGSLKLTFSINRNCRSNDSIYVLVSGDTLNLMLRDSIQEEEECECLVSYELEIDQLKSEPKVIAVNDHVHVNGFGFLPRTSATEDRRFADSLDQLHKFPLDTPVILEDVTFDKNKHKLLSSPIEFATYLEAKQFLKLELRGSLSADENDSTLSYKRAKALRDFLVRQRDICINRVAIHPASGKLAGIQKNASRSVTAYLTYAQVYDSLPPYK